MFDNSLSSKVVDDFLKRIKSEKKLRLTSALEMVERYKCDPDAVPEDQRADFGISCYFLAKQYRYGEAAELDYALSFECYKLSARLGNPKACYTLGRMYLLGNKLMCIKKNHQLALDCVKMHDNRQCGGLLREKLCNLKKTIEIVKNIHRSMKKNRVLR